MAVDSEKFRNALSRFPSGVTVVTAAAPGGGLCGVTVSAFSSLSLNPPLILICLDDVTENLAAYTEGAGFCVNILADDQKEISNIFAFPGPTPPFEKAPYELGLHGAPMLKNVLATLECRRVATHRGGDHTIIIGHVDRAAWRDTGEPLIYAGGAYRSLQPADPTPCGVMPDGRSPRPSRPR